MINKTLNRKLKDRATLSNLCN